MINLQICIGPNNMVSCKLFEHISLYLKTRIPTTNTLPILKTVILQLNRIYTAIIYRQNNVIYQQSILKTKFAIVRLAIIDCVYLRSVDYIGQININIKKKIDIPTTKYVVLVTVTRHRGHQQSKRFQYIILLYGVAVLFCQTIRVETDGVARAYIFSLRLYYI